MKVSDSRIESLQVQVPVQSPNYKVQSSGQDKLIQVKVRHFDSNNKFKIQFQNSIQDCDIVESNSSFLSHLKMVQKLAAFSCQLC